MTIKTIFFIVASLFLSLTHLEAQDKNVTDVYSDTFGFDDDFESTDQQELANNAIVLPTLNKAVLEKILIDLSNNKVNKVRAAVASNPYTPVRLLRTLLQDKSVVVRIAAASNPNLPQKDINKILLSQDSTMMVAIASNTNASINDLASILSLKNSEAILTVYGNPSFPSRYLSNMIQETSADNAILRIIATNPALQESTLQEMSTMRAGIFMPEIFYNPQSPIATIISNGVDPFIEDNTSLVQSLLLNKNVSSNLKVELVDYLSYDIIMGQKAKDPNLSIDLIREFSKSTNPALRKQVAANPSAPIDVLRELSKDESERVRINVARNPSNSFGILRDMMKDPDQYVRMSLVMNKILPDTLLHDLYDDLVLNLLVNKEIRDVLPDDITWKLIKNPDSNVRYALALCPNLSPNVLDILGSDSDDLVREAVSVNKRTSVATLNILANDPEVNVRNGVVLNENTPKETLLEISKNPDNDLYLLSDFLFNANTPTTLADVISTGMTDEMQELIKNRWINTPENKYSTVVIERMRKMFPNQTPIKSGKMKDASAALEIVANPNMPWLSIGNILYNLSDLNFSVPVFNYFSNYFYIRSTDKQIAPSGTSKILLEKMANDKNYLDKLTLAASYETEYDALMEIFENGDDWQKMLVASNPSIGVDFFRKLIDTSKNESVQCGLAQNPLMSTEDLMIFKKKFKSTGARIGVACKGINSPLF